MTAAGYSLHVLRALARNREGLTFPQLRLAVAPATGVSGILRELSRRGLVARIGVRRKYVYTITGLGLDARFADRPRPVQGKPWRRAPKQGEPKPAPLKAAPRPAPVPIVLGYDCRYQVNPATFEGGEFSRLGVGRYVDGVGA